MNIPKKDIQIITELRKNARESITAMAKKTGIPISTIFDRMKAHQGSIILKHTCLLNFGELGYAARAKVTIKVDREVREDLKNYLRLHPNVNSLYKINSGYDFMFELIFASIRDLEGFMECLEEKYPIADKNIHYIIDDIKREEFMADDHIITQ